MFSALMGRHLRLLLCLCEHGVHGFHDIRFKFVHPTFVSLEARQAAHFQCEPFIHFGDGCSNVDNQHGRHDSKGIIFGESVVIFNTVRTGEALIINVVTRCLARDLRETERVSMWCLLEQPLTHDFTRKGLAQMWVPNHMNAHASCVVVRWTKCVQRQWSEALRAISQWTCLCLEARGVTSGSVPMNQQTFRSSWPWRWRIDFTIALTTI